MAVIDQNVELWSTEDKDLNFTVSDGAGVGIDITGATISWKLAQHPSGTALVTKAGTLTTPLQGKFKVSLSASDLTNLDGVYYQEARLVDAANNDTVVATGWVTVNRGLA